MRRPWLTRVTRLKTGEVVIFGGVRKSMASFAFSSGVGAEAVTERSTEAGVTPATATASRLTRAPACACVPTLRQAAGRCLAKRAARVLLTAATSDDRAR